MTVGVGEPAPVFATRNQHGESVGTAELGETPYLLVFFPYAFTGICSSELTVLQSQLADWRELGVRVMAISCDAMFTQRVFAEREGFGFDLLTDHWPHGEVCGAFGVFDRTRGCAVRGTFLVVAGHLAWSQVRAIGEHRDMSTPLEVARRTELTRGV